jgi:hypothetical protein
MRKNAKDCTGIDHEISRNGAPTNEPKALEIMYFNSNAKLKQTF